MEKSDSPFNHKRLWGPFPNYPKVENYNPPEYKKPIIIAGPCSFENPEQIEIIAKEAGSCGVDFFRGGVFRAGTYPSSRPFGWIHEHLIAEYSRAARDYGLKPIIEVLDYYPESLRMIDKYCAAYQVGARSMQNYTLLSLMAKKKRPVFLKRNMGATLDEWLGAAEYLLKENKPEPFLIERGSSTFHNHVRWDLSISIIPAIKKLTKIPIIIDPCHGTGRRDLVKPMALAGIAAGADGVLIETHFNPDQSLSDPEQSYPLDKLSDLINEIRSLYNHVHNENRKD